jgi:hypothetical protein
MVMAEKILLLAVVAQVALTLGVLFILGRRRLPLVAAKQIKVSDIAVKTDAWPLPAQLASNNFQNQFQLPVLFYVLAAVALATNQASMWLAIGGCIFVATRYAHTFIHITKNRVYRRFYVYVSGLLVLTALWLGFAVQILFA